jgi:6-phosphogluconolactonase/glucosamine-6-phosphate isomerase/deaminase
MRQALEDVHSTLPVALVLQRAQHVRVLLDSAAASLLHTNTA